MFAGKMYLPAERKMHAGRCRIPPTPAVSVMRTFIALVLLVAAASPVSAQRISGRIEGQIIDSVHAGPLADAQVIASPVGSARDTSYYARTDNRGRFRFESLDSGRYALRFRSAMLDSIQYGGTAPIVQVSPDRATRVQLAVPSGATLRALACPGVVFTEGIGALLGIVTDAETGKPLTGAQVAVAWSDLAIDSANAIVADERAAKVDVDDAGQYRLCGLPTNDALLLQVQHAGNAGAVLRMRIPDGAGVLVRDVSFSSATASQFATFADSGPLPTGTATVHGTVRDANGNPVAGAQIRVLGTAAKGRADDRGNYELSGLPAGTQELEARQFGFGVARGPVELRSDRRTRLDVQLEKVASLTAMNVVATRKSHYPEFEQRRKEAIGGRFLDESQIRKLNLNSTYDYVNHLPGFRAVRVRWGDVRFYSISQPDCQPVVLVDDLPVASLDDLPTPTMLGALEVYSSVAGAPPSHRSPCGTLIFWTKR